jgi:RNA recognition motif-containing protein
MTATTSGSSTFQQLLHNAGMEGDAINQPIVMFSAPSSLSQQQQQQQPEGYYHNTRPQQQQQQQQQQPMLMRTGAADTGGTSSPAVADLVTFPPIHDGSSAPSGSAMKGLLTSNEGSAPTLDQTQKQHHHYLHHHPTQQHLQQSQAGGNNSISYWSWGGSGLGLSCSQLPSSAAASVLTQQPPQHSHPQQVPQHFEGMVQQEQHQHYQQQQHQQQQYFSLNHGGRATSQNMILSATTTPTATALQYAHQQQQHSPQSASPTPVMDGSLIVDSSLIGSFISERSQHNAGGVPLVMLNSSHQHFLQQQQQHHLAQQQQQHHHPVVAQNMNHDTDVHGSSARFGSSTSTLGSTTDGLHHAHPASSSSLFHYPIMNNTPTTNWSMALSMSQAASSGSAQMRQSMSAASLSTANGSYYQPPHNTQHQLPSSSLPPPQHQFQAVNESYVDGGHKVMMIVTAASSPPPPTPSIEVRQSTAVPTNIDHTLHPAVASSSPRTSSLWVESLSVEKPDGNNASQLTVPPLQSLVSTAATAAGVDRQVHHSRASSSLLLDGNMTDAFSSSLSRPASTVATPGGAALLPPIGQQRSPAASSGSPNHHGVGDAAVVMVTDATTSVAQDLLEVSIGGSSTGATAMEHVFRFSSVLLSGGSPDRTDSNNTSASRAALPPPSDGSGIVTSLASAAEVARVVVGGADVGENARASFASTAAAPTSGTVEASLPNSSAVDVVVPPSADPHSASSQQHNDVEDEYDPPVDTNVFVSGLTHDVGDLELYRLFRQFGPISLAEVVRDCHSGVSRCVGFVQFVRKSSAMSAVGDMHQKTLPQPSSSSSNSHNNATPAAGSGGDAQQQNHMTLRVRMASEERQHQQANTIGHNGANLLPTTSGGSMNNPPVLETTKIFVRHVPSVATTKSLSAYFSKFGTVTSCTIHKDISRKGQLEKSDMNMAYVTFQTTREAERASRLEHCDVPLLIPAAAAAAAGGPQGLPTAGMTIVTPSPPSTETDVGEEAAPLQHIMVIFPGPLIVKLAETLARRNHRLSSSSTGTPAVAPHQQQQQQQQHHIPLSSAASGATTTVILQQQQQPHQVHQQPPQYQYRYIPWMSHLYRQPPPHPRAALLQLHQQQQQQLLLQQHQQQQQFAAPGERPSSLPLSHHAALLHHPTATPPNLYAAPSMSLSSDPAPYVQQQQPQQHSGGAAGGYGASFLSSTNHPQQQQMQHHPQQYAYQEAPSAHRYEPPPQQHPQSQQQGYFDQQPQPQPQPQPQQFLRSTPPQQQQQVLSYGPPQPQYQQQQQQQYQQHHLGGGADPHSSSPSNYFVLDESGRSIGAARAPHQQVIAPHRDHPVMISTSTHQHQQLHHPHQQQGSVSHPPYIRHHFNPPPPIPEHHRYPQQFATPTYTNEMLQNML